MNYLQPIVSAIFAIALITGIFGGLPAGSAFAQSSEQSDQAAFGVGDTLSANQIHVITSPGRYGLGPAPSGSKYAVAGGKLIRIDPDTLKVQSILRSQSQILD